MITVTKEIPIPLSLIYLLICGILKLGIYFSAILQKYFLEKRIYKAIIVIYISV